MLLARHSSPAERVTADLDYLSGAGRRTLDAATAAVRSARHVYLTGIGSSWHAALSAAPLFFIGGCPVYVQDASKLLQLASLPPDSTIIVISRSGRSAEVVHLVAKARESGATVIGITNSEDGLAKPPARTADTNSSTETWSLAGSSTASWYKSSDLGGEQGSRRFGLD